MAEQMHWAEVPTIILTYHTLKENRPFALKVFSRIQSKIVRGVGERYEAFCEQQG